MSTVTLGEDLGIETSADLKQKLAAFLAQDGEVVLNAGDVRRIHTASVQLLCAFVQTRRQAGCIPNSMAATTLLEMRPVCSASPTRSDFPHPMTT